MSIKRTVHCDDCDTSVPLEEEGYYSSLDEELEDMNWEVDGYAHYCNPCKNKRVEVRLNSNPEE